jgi:DNA-binding beta-propeller fold protein YncE
MKQHIKTSEIIFRSQDNLLFLLIIVQLCDHFLRDIDYFDGKMMMLSSFLLLLTLVSSASAIVYNSNKAGTNDFKELVFQTRFYTPYGPDLTTDPPQPSDEVWKGYGFGMGAAEHAAYDHVEGYMYVQSEEGPYISISDWSSANPTLTPYSLDLSAYDSDLKDVVACPEQGYVFIAATDANLVLQYATVKRGIPGKPELIREIDAGKVPDNLRASHGCTYLAVANENDGEAFAEGSIHLVSGFDSNSGPTVTKVSLAGFGDEYLFEHNVAMPLSLNAMEYWDDHSDLADDLNLGEMRAKYKPSYFFMPEYLKFSSDNNKLFVNLQDNSALVQIDTSTAEVLRIDGYGLKPYKNIGVDIVKDDGCSEYISSDYLYAMRLPDAIDNLELDGVTYIFTADEGTDFDFDEFEEKYDAGDIFDGNSLDLKGFTAPTDFFDPTNPQGGPTARFNKECENYNLGKECLDGVELTVGSMAVDYSNPQSPVIDKLVLFGGRGMSVYKVPESGPIEFVWDSVRLKRQEKINN